MVLVLACQTPTPGAFQVPRLPKRLARLRRTVESKRIENFKKIHEQLKQTAKEEQQALRDFWKGLNADQDAGDAEATTELTKPEEDDEE